MLRHLRAHNPLIFAFGVAFFGIIISEYFKLYELWSHFDTFMHVLGGVAAAWFSMSLLQSNITRLAGWKQLLILASCAVFIGVVWELAEYAAGEACTLVPWLYHWFHGGDIADTLTDLVADMVGATLFTLWALRKERS